MFKKLLILTLSALLCCGAAMAADTTSMTDKARQAETQSLPSTIKHLDLVLVLDKSGSMYGLESDTIGGYNAMIAKEKDLDVDTKVTTVLFNNKVDILTDRSNINSLSDMTDQGLPRRRLDGAPRCRRQYDCQDFRHAGHCRQGPQGHLRHHHGRSGKRQHGIFQGDDPENDFR